MDLTKKCTSQAEIEGDAPVARTALQLTHSRTCCKNIPRKPVCTLFNILDVNG